MTANSTTTVKINEAAIESDAAFQAYPEHLDAYAEIAKIDAKIEALKVARAALIAPVRADMEALQVPKLVDASNATLFTLTTATRNTVDTKRLKADHPEIAEEYNKQTKVTTFKVM